MRLKFSFLFLFVLVVDVVIAQQQANVFILAGQSNMSGRGTAAELPAHPADSAVLYYYDFDPISSPPQFVTSQNEFSKLKPILNKTFGPEMGLARKLYDKGVKNIVIVKVSHGGTNLHEQWKPGSVLYQKLIDRTKEALALLMERKYTVKLQGFFWMQGESDCNETFAFHYADNLTDFFVHVRSALKMKRTPFVIGRVRLKQENPYSKIVHDAQTEVGEMKNNAFVDTDDLAVSDGTHYNAEAAITLGERMAMEWIKMRK